MFPTLRQEGTFLDTTTKTFLAKLATGWAFLFYYLRCFVRGKKAIYGSLSGLVSFVSQ